MAPTSLKNVQKYAILLVLIAINLETSEAIRLGDLFKEAKQSKDSKRDSDDLGKDINSLGDAHDHNSHDYKTKRDKTNALSRNKDDCEPQQQQQQQQQQYQNYDRSTAQLEFSMNPRTTPIYNSIGKTGNKNVSKLQPRPLELVDHILGYTLDQLKTHFDNDDAAMRNFYNAYQNKKIPSPLMVNNERFLASTSYNAYRNGNRTPPQQQPNQNYIYPPPASESYQPPTQYRFASIPEDWQHAREPPQPAPTARSHGDECLALAPQQQLPSLLNPLQKVIFNSIKQLFLNGISSDVARAAYETPAAAYANNCHDFHPINSRKYARTH